MVSVAVQAMPYAFLFPLPVVKPISFPQWSAPALYRSLMSNYRQHVLDYIRASEALLKANELSEAEMQAVQEVVDRVSEKLLDDGES